MARSTAYRKYQLTINNPEEHGFSHEILKSTLAGFSGCTYWCMCDEIGKEGTPHTHVYAAFKNAVEFGTMLQRFHGAHIEAAHGSHQENRDYLRKEGRWQDDAKHETSLPDTFEEWGELPPETDKRQSQSEQVLVMLDNGASNEEVVREFPSWMKHLKSLDAMRQTLLETRYREQFRQLRVTYIYGETGAGKTRSIMERHGYANVCRITNYDHPFDGYKGEPVILFDEFRSSLPLADMLTYLDGYPLMLPCRYSDKVACYTTAYVVSNIPIEKQYPNVQVSEPPSWNAFLRRFNGGILRMSKSSGFEPLPDTTPVPFQEAHNVC